MIELPLLGRKKRRAIAKSDIEYTELSCNPILGCSHACTYCLDGDTLILLANGTNVPIKELQIGDKIIGLKKKNTYFRHAVTTVLAHWQTNKDAFKITMENGTELICSADHRWLSDRGWKYTRGNMQGNNRRPYLTLNDHIRGIGVAISAPNEATEYSSKIISIVPLNKKIPMYDITTGTGNFIANGFVSHNCYARNFQLRYKQAESKADWHRPKIYDGFLELLQEQIDAGQVPKDKEIFVSTMTDVYQPAAVKYDIARKILIKLQDAGLIYRLLTKSPALVKDVDILDGYEKGIVGLSITTNISNDKQRKKWEPRTKPIKERLDALEKLSAHDIRLWSSVEPILPGTNITSMLDELLNYSNLEIEQIMIGKMNYQKGIDELIDWEAAISIIEGYKSDHPDIYWHYKKETVAYLEKKGIV